MEGLGRIERTDHNVVPVRITECKLFGSSVGVHVGRIRPESCGNCLEGVTPLLNG